MRNARAAALSLCLLAACAPSRGDPAGVPAAEQELPIPAPQGWIVPRDSVERLYAFPNLVESHPRGAGPYPRSVLRVGFAQRSTREERISAIRSVEARVIGGDGGALYTLVLPADRTADDLWKAADRLRALPQVGYVSADLFTLRVVPASDPTR